MKWIVVLSFLQINVLLVCAVVFTSDFQTPVLVTLARAAAWIAALNFGFVAFGISPLFQLVYQLFNFNIMHHSLSATHFHRNVAISGGIFSALHIGLLAAYTKLYGCHTPTGFVQHKWAYYCVYPAVSGGVVALGMLGAGIAGYLSRVVGSSIVSALHFPLACIGFFGLVAHTYQITLPFGTYLALVSFVSCLVIFAIFFFFNPIQPMDVNIQETVWLSGKNKYSFLVVNYNNSNSIPPGSFFLIYSNQQSNLSHFHAHSFPVFSSQDSRISFLVHCRVREHSRDISFTQRLSIGKYPTSLLPRSPLVLPLLISFALTMSKPSSLRLQGPFPGTVSSFINFLSSVNTPIDVYLCGWDAGLANIFSILEYLKVSPPSSARSSTL